MTINERADDERDDGVGRINALTDGVIAIAVTLLALDLKPDLPSSTTTHELAHYLREHLGQYIAFAIAFLVIAQYWALHRRMMKRVQRSSGALVRLTVVFLFGITLAPLTASLTGGMHNDLAVFLFAVNVLVLGATTGAMAETIRRQHLENYHEGAEERLKRQARSVMSVVVPALVAGTAWLIGGHAAYLYLLFAVADLPGALLWMRVSRPRPAAR